MPFVEEMEIPPVFIKILKKLWEEEQLEEQEFKVLVLNLRISKEDYNDVMKYLISKDLIQRIPKLSVERNGATHDVIFPLKQINI